ncbi:MAG: peptidase family protein [Acidimicrobiia bacterium]|nr:peptidase family protein [Acidimicrobiia bacterium]
MGAMGRGQFVLFGIPVRIDPMFIIGIFILASFAGSGRVALFTGVSLALFTLIHELGHALTARLFGCRNVEISLSFLVGYASYSADQPLSRGRRMLISLMGPLVQLTTAAIVLLVLYNRWPTTLTRGNLSDAQLTFDLWGAVIWGGVLLALLNLIPLWPLDGGHLAAGLLEKVVGRRAMQVMAQFTLLACVTFVVVGLAARAGDWGWLNSSHLQYGDAHTPQGLGSALWSTLRGLPYVMSDAWFILLFCGFGAWRTLKAIGGAPQWIKAEPATPVPVDGRRAADPRAVEAERQGWRTAVPGHFPEPWGPSPWLRAHLRLVHGDAAKATQELRSAATDGQWVAPDAFEPQLAPLVALLPRPLPMGDRRSSLWLMEILSQHGEGPDIGAYGNALYARFQEVEPLYLVAAGFARLGHHDEAMGWLQRAVSEQPEPQRIGTGKEFRSLHDRLDFQQLLVAARTAGR